jgi:hypothetical protein
MKNYQRKFGMNKKKENICIYVIIILVFRRTFYKNQDKLISSLERVHRLHSNKDSDNEEDNNEQEGEVSTKTGKDDEKLRKKRISFYTTLSLFVNIVSVNIEIN